MAHTFNLVLVGFGHVGRAFATLVADRADVLGRRYGVRTRLLGIATARHGCVFDPGGIDAAAAIRQTMAGESLRALLPSQTLSPDGAQSLLDEVARRNWIDPLVMVETTPLDVHEGQPATRHMLSALAAGAHVITANKGPIACAWPQLRAAATQASRSVLFESVVMDGVPIFSLVRESLPALDVTGLRGILNTTTNYVLAALEDGGTVDQAVADMQARGIAEAAPSLDLDGWDSAAKAAALANVLMDATLTPRQVDRTGIAHLTAADARAALDADTRLKLVVTVARRDGAVSASVRPEPVPFDDPFSRINGTMNALTLSTDLLGDLTVVQHGGSVVETAYGLLSDLIALSRRV